MFVQRESEDSFNPVAGFCAWRGFSLMGDDVCAFKYSELESIPLTRETIVHGGVACVRRALELVGVTPPEALGFPDDLAAFFGRRIWPTTIGAIRSAEASDDFAPVFVKPLAHEKTFAGAVVRRFRDLIPSARLPSAYPVWAQEVVSFVAEYRVFVLRGAILSVRPYRGDPLVFPDPGVIRSALGAYRGPAAFAMDFGVTDDGRTLVVEINDGFSLGDYGLNALDYARMVEARWDEMVAAVPASRTFEVGDNGTHGGLAIDNG